jgi:hypothetical protein
MSVVSVWTFNHEKQPLEARDAMISNTEGGNGIRALQIVGSVCNGAKVAF